VVKVPCEVGWQVRKWYYTWLQNLNLEVGTEDGHQENLEHLQALADNDDFHAGDAPQFPNVMTMSGVLAGSEQIELSHAGGEFSLLEPGIEDDWVDMEESEGTKLRSFPHYIALA
jgi:hypothetical protein